MYKIYTTFPSILGALVLSACTVLSPSDGPPMVSDSNRSGALPEDAIPRVEARSKYGNPKSYVVFGQRYFVLASSQGFEQKGVASWYGKKFHGRRTSNGERYDMYAMSAAHKSLPLPTYVQVTNLENGRQTIVRVNDRGPFHDNRIIDLSYSAARKLGILEKGTGLVKIRALQAGEQPTLNSPRLAQDLIPATIGKLKIYLQAGVYSLRENALSVRTRLISMTQNRVWIQKVQSGAKDLFRVRLGPLRSIEEADQLSRKMIELSMELPRIIIE